MSQNAVKTNDFPQNTAEKRENFEAQEILALIRSFSPLPYLPESKTPLGWMTRSRKDESGKGPLAGIDYPRIVLFAGSHGFAEKHARAPFLDYMKGCVEGTLRLSRLAKGANTDLRLYELDLESGTADCLTNDTPAMSESEMVRTMAYGMMTVEPELDLIAVSGFGPGSAESAEALIAIHTDRSIPDNKLIQAVGTKRGLDALRQIGGHEISAICGVILAARLARIPVLLESPAGLAALLVLLAENPCLADHCALCGDRNSAANTVTQILTPYSLPENEPGVALASTIPALRTEALLSTKR
jgi:hypothetical protein